MSNDTLQEDEQLFEAIWQAIKGWDLERSPGELYAHATGDDVRTILKSIEPIIAQREHEAELRGRIAEARYAADRVGVTDDYYQHEIDEWFTERIAALTAPTTDDTATEGGEL